MKLLQTINNRYVLISLMVLVTGGFIFYFVLENILDNQVTEQLYMEKDFFISNYLDREIPKTFQLLPHMLIQDTNKVFPESLFDTVIFNPLEKEIEPLRRLNFPLVNDNKIYSISISKPLYEKEDLIRSITWILAGVIFIQFLVIYVFGSYFNKKLFIPFFSTLNQMNSYSANKTENLKLKKSKVREFQQLNNAFKNLHNRLHKEYAGLKEFTENASHEMQTPLAILQTKIEIMQQNPKLPEVYVLSLNEMSENILKLSKMNKGLLLMSKIENDQFSETTQISLHSIIMNKLETFQELIQYKKLKASTDIKNDFSITMNAALVDILFNNLFSNAIKYSNKEETISIALMGKELTFMNSSSGIPLNTHKIFERFYKENQFSDSTGLGLSIVKQIMGIYGYTISYIFKSNSHCFILNFDQQKLND